MRMLEVNRKMRKTPKEDITFDSSMPLVLTHLDLHPQNLIVSPDGRLWVVDWEFAGWLPEYWDYTRSWKSITPHGSGQEWWDMLQEVIPCYPDELEAEICVDNVLERY